MSNETKETRETVTQKNPGKTSEPKAGVKGQVRETSTKKSSVKETSTEESDTEETGSDDEQ
jgi:hypothetical protein